MVQSLPLLFVDVGNLVKSAIADQPAMWKRQIEFFANNCLLNFHNLRHVIRCRLELGFLDAFVDSTEKRFVDVRAVVDTAKVLDEVIWLHSAVGFDIGRVEISVEHDDGKGKDENLKFKKEIDEERIQ